MPEVIFNGPDGRLEGRYHKSKKDDAPIAIVLHPPSAPRREHEQPYRLYNV